MATIHIPEIDDLIEQFSILQLELEKLKSNMRQKIVPAEVFCERYGYKLNTFYRKAPKGMIPGAMKIAGGRKWYVDVAEFESAIK